MLERFFIVFCLLYAHLIVCAQNNFLLTVSVLDENNLPIYNAKVNAIYTNNTNREGIATFLLHKDNHKIGISAEKYQEKEFQVYIKENKHIKVVLQKENVIEELIITAREGKGLASSSIIDRKAMSHLQPSSFTDLLELLPGKLSIDPALTNRNSISLREAMGRPSSYATNSLGIQFIVDDNVLNTNANLQSSIDNEHMGQVAVSRNTVSTGVDMRTISTNDIERVEIIRGIPSAAYGDLSSGLVKIDRKIVKFPLQARFKVDGFSKQYYIGKGFSVGKNWSFSTGMDYLDAKRVPTNEFENYKRITASIRSKMKTYLWGKDLEWRSIFDISHNIDNERYDPDTGYAPVDKYTNRVVRISLANNFLYELPKDYIFNKWTINTSVRLGLDRIEQIKLVQHTGLRSVSLATEAGENVGYFPELKYISDFYTDGKPLDISTLLKTEGKRSIAGSLHHIEMGLDWRYSKNLGEGQVWNPITPPSNTLGIRHRAYRDIPSWQNIALFIGDNIQYHLGKHHLQFYVGLRLSKLLGVDTYIV